MQWAAFELMAGANPAVCFYVLGNLMAKIIDALGTPAQKQRYVQNMLDAALGRDDGADRAGRRQSDVGAGTTKATHVAGDEYLLEGVKRFITNGDFDHPTNIVHMVLARPEGAGPGTKGLSLFIVPKYWVEADGSLGARNGAVVTKVEHKMGIKGSATCELTLGDGAPCRGLLLGEVHQRHRADVPRHRVRADGASARSRWRRCRPRTSTRSTYTRDAQAGRRPRAADRQGRAARRDHARTPTCAGC